MAEMTSKERLLAAIAHREADRVPVAPRMHLWSTEQFGSHSWLQQLRLRDEFGTDAFIEVHYNASSYIRNPFGGDYRDLEDVSVELTVENEGSLNTVRRLIHTPAGDLSDVIDMPHPRSRYGLSPSPTHRECLVKGPEDVEKICFLLPDPHKVTGTNWPEIIEIIGDRGLMEVHMAAGVGGPVLSTAVGVQDSMLLFYDDREMFDRLLEMFGEYHRRVTKRMLELGAPVIFQSWHDFGVSAGWSPKIWRASFGPIIKANVDLVHSYGAIYHYFDNGPVTPLLSDIAELGVDIISTLTPPPVGDVDIAEAKRLIGDRVCLVGNVDAIWIVQSGTPEQVREAVRETIRATAPGGGFILGNSDCFFSETPRENIDAFFEAAREFGRYPINLS